MSQLKLIQYKNELNKQIIKCECHSKKHTEYIEIVLRDHFHLSFVFVEEYWHFVCESYSKK
jgi:hypothetical protein